MSFCSVLQRCETFEQKCRKTGSCVGRRSHVRRCDAGKPVSTIIRPSAIRAAARQTQRESSRFLGKTPGRAARGLRKAATSPQGRPRRCLRERWKRKPRACAAFYASTTTDGGAVASENACRLVSLARSSRPARAVALLSLSKKYLGVGTRGLILGGALNLFQLYGVHVRRENVSNGDPFCNAFGEAVHN